MRRDVRDASGTKLLVLGSLAFLAGAAIVSVALGWVHVDPSDLLAPRWVIGLAGAVFLLMGGLILHYVIRNGLRGSASPAGGRDDQFFLAGWLVGGLMVTAMAAVAAWIAFGPGDRQFSSSFGVGGGFLGGSSPSDEAVGRTIFGVGAVVTGAFAIWGWIHGIRRILGSGPEEPGETDPGE